LARAHAKWYASQVRCVCVDALTRGDFTLGHYCEEHNIEYADLGIPVRVEDFCAYGLAFQQRFAPNLDNKRVTSLERNRTGFTLRLSDGENFTAQRVVIATGLSHFEHVPPQLAVLPKELWSHSSAHVHLHRFKGRDVTVIGGGASATELATLLHEAGCSVRMVARRTSIELHSRMELSRTLAQTIRRPISPVGPGWQSRFFTDLPLIFHNLPKSVQNRLVKGFLGPAGGWFLRGRFEQVPLLAGYEITGAEASRDRAILWLIVMEWRRTASRNRARHCSDRLPGGYPPPAVPERWYHIASAVV
jgi:hypothetical protein